MTILNNRYTPATMGPLKCSIPLYQRLFEWEAPQIEQLLTDLHMAFKNNSSQPYYIGMLTAFKENGTYSLVDGQQRFTVLTLMAIAFDTEAWRNFVKIDDNFRLSFFARKKDEEYLKQAFEKAAPSNDLHINRKMQRAIESIKKFLQDNVLQNKNEFIQYIYEHVTFFLSELPKEYAAPDLNKYFEAMNATGKGLENYEILKVELLRILPDEERVQCTRIWNLASNMDECLLRRKSDSDITEFRERQAKALSVLDETPLLLSLCNDFKDEKNGTRDFQSIRNVESNNTPPDKQFYTRSERAIMTFTDFLLQVLKLHLSANQLPTPADFFNGNKLLETFKVSLSSTVEVKNFMDNLLKYRILFDYFILRINHNDNNNVSYFLNFNREEGREEKDREIEKQLLQYQSMLYVSTTTNLWLTDFLLHIEEKPTKSEAEHLLKYLKDKDNKRSESRNPNRFSYGFIDRYWFWRLDYYLWEGRTIYFEGESLRIAEKYVFKPNRSVEHIAPQTSQLDDVEKVTARYMDCFGNLAMISSGQNSSLQNASYELKRAHVDAYIKGSKGGSIESLKMLKIYKNSDWDDDKVISHSDEMITILANSYLPEYRYIKTELNSNLFFSQPSSTIDDQ